MQRVASAAVLCFFTVKYTESVKLISVAFKIKHFEIFVALMTEKQKIRHIILKYILNICK